ncbi:MAG TPA: Hsp33 family molecular chaperone HslO [Noviherbaspirillum sp.]|jgi:molecular chaperone Hsp33|uniref:Hsp33 family molecular chaperone HslO n=1 Tax=Noviherbaspirillum sp. TaxID=1926288 RepID=UPI002DDD0A91|nr:Hsp33 family molecular chaperone HslO [Noviherbaspirillum sp.]HEV2612756.1 Hsp33 family molecular chaperone HslO [Noviherbaspirillum sp.]
MDTLQKFMFDNGAVRGELVDVSDTWKQVLARQQHPTPVNALLGEMLAAAALLSANLKFNGAIVMQIHGDGPVRLLVVECDSSLRLRATAKLSAEANIDADATLKQLLNQNGHGRFVITLDPQDKLPGQQPYQGIVPLDGDSIAEVIENYMLRSEQLDTRLWLAANDSVSHGLLLQKMPKEGGVDVSGSSDIEIWNRTVMLASTLGKEELLATDIKTLMHRLFWEETIRLFEAQHPTFHCSCSREKVGNMLKMLGKPEVDSALDELGKLGINCDFCGQHYEFDRVDCAQLFATETSSDGLQAPGKFKH